MAAMRVELTEEEAGAAARCLLMLRAIQSEAAQQTARVQVKIAELEAMIRARVKDIPDTGVEAWNWSGLDLIEGKGAVEIPSPAVEIPPPAGKKGGKENGTG